MMPLSFHEKGSGHDALLIGALAPLSSPGWGDAGLQLVAGLEDGVEQVNRAGGVAGRPLKLAIRDTAGTPAVATRTVQELHALGAIVLAGEYHSVAAQAAAAEADRLRLPFLCSSAVMDDLVPAPTDWVARLAPPQSRGWHAYADFLASKGHRRVAIAIQPSVYWEAGAAILARGLRPHGIDVVAYDATVLNAEAIRSAMARDRPSALLLLTAHPEPSSTIVRSVRHDERFANLTIGAPAGQPELAGWREQLGLVGSEVPFLRYMPRRLEALGVGVAARLKDRLGAPSFVAFEGHDAIIALAAAIRIAGPDRRAIAASWSKVSVAGSRGTIAFSRPSDSPVHLWAGAPIQIVEGDPGAAKGFRTLVQMPDHACDR